MHVGSKTCNHTTQDSTGCTDTFMCRTQKTVDNIRHEWYCFKSCHKNIGKGAKQTNPFWSVLTSKTADGEVRQILKNMYIYIYIDITVCQRWLPQTFYLFASHYCFYSVGVPPEVACPIQDVCQENATMVQRDRPLRQKLGAKRRGNTASGSKGRLPRSSWTARKTARGRRGNQSEFKKLVSETFDVKLTST